MPAALTASRSKEAGLGGDGRDTSFEQSFANLAHAYLQDKAPTLQEHELGFQLIDRDDDGTKAAGVFAFKVGSQRLFAPVFFLKGELKGHELLYMRDSDSFVPLKENWVNYILNRRPPSLGAGIGRMTSQLGVRPPDLSRLSTPPSKMASVRMMGGVGRQETNSNFLPLYGHLTSADLSKEIAGFTKLCHDRLDLSHFLSQASMPVLDATVELFRAQPHIAKAFDEWHGLNTLDAAIKSAQSRIPAADSILTPVNKNQSGSLLEGLTKAAAKSVQSIEVITLGQSKVDGLPENFSDQDREQLIRDGVVFRDHRTDGEKSIRYNVQVKQQLMNPTQTGIYQVLTNTGEYERCVLLMNPHGPAGRINGVTVIRLDEGTRNWGNFSPKDVWVAGVDESLLGGPEAWLDWFKDLPEGELPAADSDTRCVLIGPTRDGTCPFAIARKTGESEGTQSYDVRFTTELDGCCSIGIGQVFDKYSPWHDGERVHIDSKDGTKLRSAKGDLYVPKSYKVMRLSPTRSDKRMADDDKPRAVTNRDTFESDVPPIRPGRMLEAALGVMQKTASLRVGFDGVNYTINNAARPMDPTTAIISLVKGHGFSVDDGRDILKTAAAEARRGHWYDCRVKYANPFLTEGGPSAPAYPDFSNSGYNPMGFQGGDVQSPMQQQIPVPDLSAALTDRSIYNVNPAYMPEPMDANGVNQAVQSGQREVFDTAMIGSLLRTVRDDTLVDRYLPDLMDALDSLGRLLFMFYWHSDKFSDRYGKQDMPELEDSLRNAFEMVGDVVIFLKQKTVEAYPDGQVQDMDLSAAS